MAETLPLPPHPRERQVLFGHEAAERAVADAIAIDRLPHAWLVGGPPGIGKATFAYRLARALLAPPGERSGEGLAVDGGGRTARLVAARAHPNLAVLERASPDGDKAAPRTIAVEAVRKTLAFFGATAADGGRRVCIVDALDDVTLNGVNALLKTVEEPPARSTILILSHAPERVLPTIRSRCRKLILSPLAPDAMRLALASLGPAVAGLPDATLARAADLADGSVGRALTLLDPKRQHLIGELEALLDGLPARPTGRIMALAERLADRKGEDDLAVALDTVRRWAENTVRSRSALGPRRLAPLAEVCDKLAETTRAVETYNLDRKPFVVALFEDLAAAVRHAA